MTLQIHNAGIRHSQVPSAWRQVFQRNIRDWKVLADFLELSNEQRDQILTDSRFPLNIPLRLAKKMKKGSLEDPLLKQFLPMKSEAILQLGFGLDPVGDCQSRKSPQLLHKYAGRVLLVATGVCAMHCRYCFRQHFDYGSEDKSFDAELELIRKDESIHEVILSGGDPLALSDRALKSLLERISAIPHIKRIRFHTRFIVGIPERIDESFMSILEGIRPQIVFVLHINHPEEIDEDIIKSVKALLKAGVVVLNQSVLLKGVNDDLKTLSELCEKLVNSGVMPYYLHQLDKVAGAAHFEVSEEKGKMLIQELNKLLPGYAVPKYVREVTGEPGKLLV